MKKISSIINQIKSLVKLRASVLKYLEDSYTVLFQTEQRIQDRNVFRAAEMQAIQYLVSLLRTIARRLYILKHLARLPLVKMGLVASPQPLASAPDGQRPAGSSHTVR